MSNNLSKPLPDQDSKKKRLILKEKIDLNHIAEIEKLSLRDLWQKYVMSEKQLSNVVKDSEEIKFWISNSNKHSNS